MKTLPAWFRQRVISGLGLRLLRAGYTTGEVSRALDAAEALLRGSEDLTLEDLYKKVTPIGALYCPECKGLCVLRTGDDFTPCGKCKGSGYAPRPNTIVIVDDPDKAPDAPTPPPPVDRLG